MVPEQHHHIAVDELPGLTDNSPVVIAGTPGGLRMGLLPGAVPLHVREALESALSKAMEAGLLTVTEAAAV
ncbi:hypothetical protein ACU686_44430 [Yinghuangia aomiensis]